MTSQYVAARKMVPAMTQAAWKLREATPADRQGVISLIDRVYSEYQDRVNLEGAERELLSLPEAYSLQGGAFIVLVESLDGFREDERVVGCHATEPTGAEQGTFRRLYLDVSLRGSGWGDRLMQWAVDWSEAAGWNRIAFWSDTRFERAHRFFERFGFQRTGGYREMSDGIFPYAEYEFERWRPTMR